MTFVLRSDAGLGGVDLGRNDSCEFRYEKGLDPECYVHAGGERCNVDSERKVA